MKKYQSIKHINLLQKESLSNKSSTNLYNGIQSLTQSSQQSINRDTRYQFTQCFTDRTRNTRINQFSITPSSASLTINTQCTSPTHSIKSNIKTYIRFKPFTKEQLLDETNKTNYPNGIDILDSTRLTIDQNHCYTYDRIFLPETPQHSIYTQTSKQLISCFINGYNGTIIAYGQTGSGKTYTMFGQRTNIGIIPESIHDLFTQLQTQKVVHQLKQLTLQCSMFQIYKQNICDLMTEQQREIKIKENCHGEIQIENLTIKSITNQEELLMYISKGTELRKIRQTEINQHSSRSHLIFTLYLTTQVNQFESRTSKLNLVDLAGSEKVSKSKVTGEGLQQAIKINLSLSCLGNTINALSRGQDHIPFRDSKLTRVLQQSLSGNSITRIIVTCSLLSSCREETISSLKFANRIKKIKMLGTPNVKKINQQGVNKFVFQTLKIEYQNCWEKLEKIKGVLAGDVEGMGKEDILRCLKSILYEGQKQQEEGQFEGKEAPQLFTNLEKEEEATGFSHEILPSCQNTSMISMTLEKQVKNLSSIVLKQQSTIKNLNQQLLKSRKNSEINLPRSSYPPKNLMHRLKILKSNFPTTTHKPKTTTTVPKLPNKDPPNCKQNPPFQPSKNNQQQKQNCNTFNIPVQQHPTSWKQKLQYEKMEKSILIQQVQSLVLYIRELRKMILANTKNIEQPQLDKLYTTLCQINEKKQTEPSILVHDQNHKNSERCKKYQLPLQKFQPILTSLTQQNKNRTTTLPLPNKHKYKNSCQNLIKGIQIFLNPITSSTFTQSDA